MNNQSAMPEKRGYLKPHMLYRCFTRLVGMAGILLFFLAFSCSQKLPTAPVTSQAPNPAAGKVSAGPQAGIPVIGNLLEKMVGKLIGWLGAFWPSRFRIRTGSRF